MTIPRIPVPLDSSRILLVSGLWPYNDVDEKKAVGRLNVFHNPELRSRLAELVGASSVYDIGYRVGSEVRQLFHAATEVEPTLVSVALSSLLPEDAQVTEVEVADVLRSEDHASWAAAARDGLCLLSTSYITNFSDLSRVVTRLRETGVGHIVAGGYLATRNPERVLDCGIDMVVAGDAEEAVPALLNCLRASGSSGPSSVDADAWAAVPNLWYWGRDGERVFTFDRMVAVDDIRATIPAGDLSGISVPYESMRGCPYKCAFCSYPLVSTKWRFKSAEKLIADWTLIEKGGAKEIIALDSTFTIPPKRLRDFLKMYREAGLTVPWGAYSRVTPLKNEETVIQLKRANNRWLSIGFESGSQKMLDLMHKGTRVKDAFPALANLRRHQVAPWSNFIIGYPGETEETAAETVAFMSRHLFGFYGIYVFNIRDRGMPVLSDPTANLHWEDVGSEWSHSTMNSEQATRLRWESYLKVCVTNPEAINVDVFRGSNVEKDYGIWDAAFPSLKHIELWSLHHVDPDAFRAAGGPEGAATERALRELLVPLR
ncbi:B12-binding domain-containing radical SAM protein [Streptomyces althioticus]|uniref:B12-binding domain-containing radical SAM protein n=1 Tax=Streptomyces althioticus TaxID=83380 RepID=UPI0033ED830A